MHPAVIAGDVVDFRNLSYAVQLRFADPGEYTLEVVVTFSAPPDFDELPLRQRGPASDGPGGEGGAAGEAGGGGGEEEPGYEGYMAAGFPLSVCVEPPAQP